MNESPILKADTILQERYRIISWQSEAQIINGESHGDELPKKPFDAGTFARIYQGVDLHNNRLYTVKQNLYLSSDGVERIHHEAAILRQLHHPGIPKYYDAFDEGPNSYLVMEYIPGKNLLQLLQEQRGEPFHQLDVVKIGQQVCEIAAYIHKQGILHRDIKPANLIQAERGRLVLIDFGAADWLDTVTYVAREQATPSVASPEQLLSNPENEQTDVYAIGATLYMLLTGRALPPADYIIKSGIPAQPIWDINSKARKEICYCIHHAILIDEAKRYETAEAFACELNRVAIFAQDHATTRRIARQPQPPLVSVKPQPRTTRPPPSSRQPPAKPNPLRRMVIPLAGLSMCLIAGLGSYFTVGVFSGLTNTPSPEYTEITKVTSLSIVKSAPPNTPLEVSTDTNPNSLASVNLTLTPPITTASHFSQSDTPIATPLLTPTASQGIDTNTPTPRPRTFTSTLSDTTSMSPGSTSTPSRTPEFTTMPMPSLSATTPAWIPSRTPTFTATLMLLPSATLTWTPTKTNNPTTALPTLTPIPPTSTPTNTFTPTPTVTNTPESTAGPIVFLSDRQPPSNGYFYIFTMNTDGSNQTVVPLPTNSMFTGNYGGANLSLDGQDIVFISFYDGGLRSSIVTVDVGGTSPAIIFSPSSGAGGGPKWSKNKSKIVFSTYYGAVGNMPDIYVMNSNGTGLTNITQSSYAEEYPMWSPDGMKIFFMRPQAGLLRDFYAMNADGSNVVQITTIAMTNGENYRPSLSPDGTKIAFTSNRNSGQEIFVIDINNQVETRLTNVATDGASDYVRTARGSESHKVLK